MSANKQSILVVEDEGGISNFITAILTSNDYQVVKAETGKAALTLAASYSPEVVLLDLGLPDMDGLEVLRKLREWSSVPVIVVSARGHEREKVEALDLGADDYVTKPFGTSELLARIRTALRHHLKGNGENAEPGMGTGRFMVGDLVIDYGKRMVWLAEQEVHFTPIEYKILVLLSRHAGKVLTHAFISREVWGPYTNENQALRVNMANIRRKLEVNPAEPKYILTEVGVGYRMIEGDNQL
jgi:two-component system KDP operon response regulator KdpE